MNELLQKHGCANVFTVPEGLKELMSDITREVLRQQPEKIFDFIANYLSALLITREHGVMAAKILDDLCDCRPSVSEHLIQLGVPRDQAETMARIINEEIAALEPATGKEKVREYLIVKKILARVTLDEDMSSRVCQVIRNTYRDYWYRKKTLQENMKVVPTEPWEIAAEHTLEIYKRTKPSFDELNRATLKIQAAYRGYHVRRNVLRHLKTSGPKMEIPGPPRDIAGEREIDLGRVIQIKTKNEDVDGLFYEEAGKTLYLKFDPKQTITHVEPDEDAEEKTAKPKLTSFSVTNKKPPTETVMMTSVQSVFRPTQIPETIETIGEVDEEELKESQSRKRTHRRTISKEGFAPIISFADVPPEVFMLNAEPGDDVEQILEETESTSAFADILSQEVPEDIAVEDDYGEDTVPTVSSANSTIEDIVSDVGEEQR